MTVSMLKIIGAFWDSRDCRADRVCKK